MLFSIGFGKINRKFKLWGETVATDFSRTIGLIGETAFEKLKNAHVMVFGVGGVGSFAAEAVARAGVGRITLIDNDTVAPSNLNRQLVALHSTIGQPKAEVARRRILDINPDCRVTAVCLYYDENLPLDLHCDYIIDAIDSVPAKLHLLQTAVTQGVPIVSSMGTGNKICPEQLELADISKTSVCPLAKKIRVELRKRGILHLPVVYSKEIPLVRSTPPASISFVPPAAGLLAASAAVRGIIGAAQ